MRYIVSWAPFAVSVEEGESRFPAPSLSLEGGGGGTSLPLLGELTFGFVPSRSFWSWVCRLLPSTAFLTLLSREIKGAARIARCLPSPSHRRHHLRRPEPDRDRPADETPTLEALADAVGPDQIVYLSLASSEPFPSPLAAAAEWSSPAAAAAPGWVVVRGGAIGTWAAARGAAEGSGIVDDELAGYLSAAAAEEEVRARHAPPAGGGGGVPAGRTG